MSRTIYAPRVTYSPSTGAMNSCRFTVSGAGPFPFDMLRFDRCFPVTPDAAAQMHVVEGNIHREVELVSWQGSRNWLPTVERWRSFGWIVVNKDREG